MSTEPAISQSTEEALREIQIASDLYKQSKGKKPPGVTEARSREWSDYVAMILLDTTYPPDSFLSTLTALPSSISASGAITAWPSMTKERRTAYLRWVETLDSRRSASHKAALISGLLEHSPETSADLLCHTSAKSKEAKERLASALLTDASDKVPLLLTGDSSQDKVPEILKRLLELVDVSKVTAETKWQIIRLALQTMAARDLFHGLRGTALLRLIEIQIPGLPPAIQQEMKTVLTQLDANLIARFFPRQSSPSESQPISAVAQGPQTAILVTRDSVETSATPAGIATLPLLAPSLTGNVSTSDKSRKITQQLSGWLTTLQQHVKILQDLQEHIGSLEEQRAHVDNELRQSQAEKDVAANAAAEHLAAYRAAEEKVRTLEAQLREAGTTAQLAQEQIDLLRRNLVAAEEKEKTLREELTQQQAMFSQERSELFDRIKTNAERRIEEYRNGLSSSFARLFRGVPGRRSNVSGETGEVLLARLYEVIDFLESKSIRVLPDEGDHR